MKICTIIGARPQFVKAAAVSAEFAKHKSINEIIIHTGQHYDHGMSEIFFKELNVPHEKYNLEIGSGSHGAQTGKMLEAIEKVLQDESPDYVLIYGDTNSTLAGALCASKLHIPIAHIEAGMRSFNKKMPEEINRIVADHLSEINFCSTKTAMVNLKNEKLADTGVLVGDVMFDCSLKFAELAEKRYNPFAKFAVGKNGYALLTCHRAENTDYRECLAEIVKAVNKISEKMPVLYPVHPRTRKFLNEYGLSFSENVKLIDPVGYLEMVLLEKHSSLILTDSGGVQKEAFFYRVPCITMREETEWIETVDLGWNKITGADSKKIIAAFADFAKNKPAKTSARPYGNGDAAAKIVGIITKV
ncbi:MAG: UDP-N-acetylglucosamine 2-epimerase (non-hydrolyzing) [Lentisphaerae bacterium]|nr:UDP-N-acetylglucosamine 2-epimerase (non-hydrolyzing) [Lentisphaerota bacterium]